MGRQPRSEFLTTLEARGFIQDATDYEGLDERLLSGVVPGYVGFDCTAPSLHVGHLFSIMALRWLQRCGGRPICLMGGGTTRIGDPTGRDEARKMLTEADISANMAGIRRVFANYVSFDDSPTAAVMPNNADWLDGLKYIEFLRDYGRHFSVNRMLSFDSVRLRLDREQNLSFLEFNYMLLQAYDFLELHRRHGCVLQMGGSDQWGNIVNGVDLTRRVAGAEVFGLTTPLLTKADGSKMGKTAGGAVWLSAEMLSPYEFWQFWRNTADADVERLLRIFTELPLDEVARLCALGGSEINEAKKALANEATALCHGRAAAEAAEATARETFERGGAGAALPTVAITVPPEGVALARLLVEAGLSGSGKDAKRLIAEGGARVDDAVVTDAAAVVPASRFDDGPVKLSAGRKRHALATRA